ncbi:Beta-xylosidase, GH43 family [Mucilaginibacter pineti]|uniref:Beta-xylosidase, GH43 family n=1 Tax=Mucilaginibacter pineti TaxID=1391627 RepID=A0A1G6XAC4_9SPHI|nr:glycoside hydrolase family 43 protein [Mucilaginibacter pineti]SDD74246.1 Beta-xylosidase, GH43 family [Mucilaginibacter pineti]
MNKIFKLIILLLCFAVTGFAQTNTDKTFTNPLLPSGADPWVIYKDGYYYYTNSAGNRLVIWKTKSVARLSSAEKKTIWVPPAGTSYSKELWAPELHFLKDKWYMYFAADDGNNNNHRIYVLENSSADPTKGDWTFKGKVGDETNKWAIDVSVFENNGQLYMLWAGWEGDENGQQNIYIAKMKDPLTIDGPRVKISTPTYDWEKYGDLGAKSNPPHVNVNEGPEILKHKNKLFLVYSASGCWTDYYALGMLTASKNSDLLNPASWTKSPQPVFKEAPANSVYAPGHNSFFKSPDGTEDWILYHANSQPGQGCGNERSPRMQKFSWNKDGSPNFGVPLKAGIAMDGPSEKNK